MNMSVPPTQDKCCISTLWNEAVLAHMTELTPGSLFACHECQKFCMPKLEEGGVIQACTVIAKSTQSTDIAMVLLQDL